MSRTATLEQSIPPAVQTQKAVLLAALDSHKQHIDDLKQSIEKAQTLDELLSNMRAAADKMI